MKSDIEIARECRLKPIEDIARQVQIPVDELEHYGKYIAKVPESLIDEKKVENSNLILVTAITPTKAGIGKTTVSVGLALGLSHIGKKNIVALREPSLGPCFGLKGGAAGGGYAQILPMDKINLHFTGDFHAVTSAHNMIAALLDNYIYQHQAEGFGLKQILWRRVLDVNDRSLRHIVTGLGPHTNGLVQESGFDITPASEIMAILCLSKDLDDMKLNIHKVQCVLKPDMKPEDLTSLDKVNVEQRGSLCTITARGSRGEVEAVMASYEPVFFECIPLSLEEIFISETEVAGYDIRKLIL